MFWKRDRKPDTAAQADEIAKCKLCGQAVALMPDGRCLLGHRVAAPTSHGYGHGDETYADTPPAAEPRSARQTLSDLDASGAAAPATTDDREPAMVGAVSAAPPASRASQAPAGPRDTVDDWLTWDEPVDQRSALDVDA